MEALAGASTVITILVLASQAFKCTYQTIEEIADLPKVVASIRDELRALELIMNLIKRAASQNPDVICQLEPLLKHCTAESGKFSALITKCTTHSSTPRRRLLDWGKFKLAQKKIEDFRSLLGRAKMNISLAIGVLNLDGVSITAKLIEEIKELIEKNSIEVKQHMAEVIDGLRQLNERGSSISDDDRARWDELQIEKLKCEKEISSLAEVSQQLEKIELDHLDSVLSNNKIHRNVQKALKIPAYDPMTISDVRDFVTKLPHLIYELNTRLSFVELEQEFIVSVTKEARERLQAEKEVDENCMQNLEEVTRKMNEKSVNVLRDVHGAQNSDQILVSTFDQLLHCENISTGPGGRLLFGTMSEKSFQSLHRTRDAPASPSTMQFSATPSRRENLVVLYLIGLLSSMVFMVLFKSNHV